MVKNVARHAEGDGYVGKALTSFFISIYMIEDEVSWGGGGGSLRGEEESGGQPTQGSPHL